MLTGLYPLLHTDMTSKKQNTEDKCMINKEGGLVVKGTEAEV